MPTAKLYNLARVSTATTGTGPITLGAAVAGHLTFAQAGVSDGETVTYAIADGTNSEIGRGVIGGSGGTLTRGPLASTNAGAAISLSGSAEVAITAAAQDFDVADFGAETVPAADDLLWLHDVSAADRRRMTLGHALKVIAALAEDAAPAQDADFVATYDASAGAVRKVRARNIGFPAGTAMLFQQSSAPTGWTKSAAHNDKVLRVVSGAAGSGGALAFSSVFGRTATDGWTLSLAQIPAHNHAWANNGARFLTLDVDTDAAGPSAGTAHGWVNITPATVGGGAPHDHGIDLRVQYVDVIVATKD